MKWLFTFCLLLCYYSLSAQNPCASPPDWEITTDFQINAVGNSPNGSIGIGVLRPSTRNTIRCRRRCASMPSNLPRQRTSARIQIVKVGTRNPTRGTYTGFNCRTNNLNWTGNLGSGNVLVHNRAYTMSRTLSQTITNLSAGTYIIGVRLGTDDSHSAYKYTTVTLSPIVSQRDIYPSNLSFANTVEQGQRFTVSATDNFRGTGSNYYSPNWGIYLSTNCTFGSSDILLASGSSSIGEADSSDPISADISISNTGSYYILVVSDINNEVNETNETNNVTCSPITINARRENVWLEGLSVSNPIWRFNDRITIAVRQHIQTNIDYNQSIRLSYGIGSTCSPYALNYVRLGGDASSIDVNNTSEVESLIFNVPRLPSGLQKLIVNADEMNIVNPETSDTDNLSCLNVYIEEFHEFYIDNISLSSPVQGANMQVNFEHFYQGNSSSLRYALAHIYYSSDAFLDASDRVLKYEEGLFSYRNFVNAYNSSFTFPSDIPLGAGYLIMKADSPDSYAEINETNNIVVIPINVQAPCTPVRANFSASPNPTNTLVRAGETVNFRDISTGSIAWNRFEWQIPNVTSSWNARDNVSSFSVRIRNSRYV